MDTAAWLRMGSRPAGGDVLIVGDDGDDGGEGVEEDSMVPKEQ